MLVGNNYNELKIGNNTNLELKAKTKNGSQKIVLNQALPNRK